MEQIVIFLLLFGAVLLVFYVVVEYKIGVSPSRIFWQLSLASIVQVLWMMRYELKLIPPLVLNGLVLFITILIMVKKNLKLGYWIISNLLITPSISFFHYQKLLNEDSATTFMSFSLGTELGPLILTILYFIVQLTLWIAVKFIKWVKFSN